MATMGVRDVAQEQGGLRASSFLSAQRREEGRTAGGAEAYLLRQLSRGMQAKSEKALSNQDKCRPRACRGLL